MEVGVLQYKALKMLQDSVLLEEFWSGVSEPTQLFLTESWWTLRFLFRIHRIFTKAFKPLAKLP
jgi:hypothetical protein